MTQQPIRIIAFEGSQCIGTGDFIDVAKKAKQSHDKRSDALLLIFDAETSRPVEIDFRGSMDDVERRIAQNTPAQTDTAPTPRGPGRPKLGVVAREITLLPRHWDWLAQQPGGASVVLRKLVDDARKASPDKDRVRQAQESAYRFMSAMAGNSPHYEDALRALYANDKARFEASTAEWPPDIRTHACHLVAAAFQN